MIRYLVPAALVIGGVALLALRSPNLPAAPPERAEPSPIAAISAAPPRLARTGAEIFGINEAVTIPKMWIERGLISPDQEPAALADDASRAVNLGAHMVRANTPVYPYLDMYSMVQNNWDWTRADLWVKTVQVAGLEPLMMVGPWPGNQTGLYTQRYLPSDMEAYSAYVRRVVERYDGDGVDDMPGLKRGVIYWEVDNEPDLHNSRPPRGSKAEAKSAKPENFQTPAEYGAVLVASSAAIRAASPAAKVLSAGLYTPRSAEGRSYLSALATQPGVAAAIDIVSVHCYFDEDSLDPVARTLQVIGENLPGKPIWVTETSVAAKGEPAGQDEDWQAGMVAAIYGGFLAGGADRIFWHTLADPPFLPQQRSTMPFATNSLLRVVRTNPGPGAVHGPGGEVQDKPAGQVYRRLAALMASSDPAQYREEPASGGRLLWTGTGWLAFWGAPVAPKGAGLVTDLRTGKTSAASGAVSAPAFIAVSR